MKQLSKLHGEVVRVSAVNAVAMKEELMSTNPMVPPGVAACWLSHQEAYERFLASDEPLALIVEDDVVVEDHLTTTLRILDADPSRCPGILQVGFLHGNALDHAHIVYRNWRMRAIWLLGITLKHSFASRLGWHRRLRIREVMNLQLAERGFPREVPSEFCAGTHAYVISRQAAQTLLSVNRPVAFSADGLLMGLAKMRGVPIRRLTRSEASQADVADSDIGKFRFADNPS